MRIHYGIESSVSEIALSSFDKEVDAEAIINQIIPYLAAGVAAE
jgi:hypothetical protein